jgi:hypothetical protein
LNVDFMPQSNVEQVTTTGQFARLDYAGEVDCQAADAVVEVEEPVHPSNRESPGVLVGELIAEFVIWVRGAVRWLS